MKIGKRDAALVFPESGEMEIIIPNEKECPDGVGPNVIIATIFGIMITSNDKEFKRLFAKYRKDFDRKYQKVKSK